MTRTGRVARVLIDSPLPQLDHLIPEELAGDATPERGSKFHSARKVGWPTGISSTSVMWMRPPGSSPVTTIAAPSVPSRPSYRRSRCSHPGTEAGTSDLTPQP